MRKNVKTLTERQVQVLAPHIQRAVQVQQELQGIQAELNSLILSYAPPQYDEVKLDTSADPWVLFVDAPERKRRATAKGRKK